MAGPPLLGSFKEWRVVSRGYEPQSRNFGNSKVQNMLSKKIKVDMALVFAAGVCWSTVLFYTTTSVFIMYTRCPTGWSFSTFHCHFGHTFRCFFPKTFHFWTLFGPKGHAFEPKWRPEGIRQTSAVILGRFGDHLGPKSDVRGGKRGPQVPPGSPKE